MRLIDAAHHLVRRFPGGVDAVAPRLMRADGAGTKAPGVLRHELAGTGTNKLGLEDAELITLMAIEQRLPNPLAILNAFAANCGAVVTMLPAHWQGGATISRRDLADAMRQMSEFIESVADGAEDDAVSDNELARVDKELEDLMAAVQAMRARVAAINAAGKPGARKE